MRTRAANKQRAFDEFPVGTLLLQVNQTGLLSSDKHFESSRNPATLRSEAPSERSILRGTAALLRALIGPRGLSRPAHSVDFGAEATEL